MFDGFLVGFQCSIRDGDVEVEVCLFWVERNCSFEKRNRGSIAVDGVVSNAKTIVIIGVSIVRLDSLLIALDSLVNIRTEV